MKRSHRRRPCCRRRVNWILAANWAEVFGSNAHSPGRWRRRKSKAEDCTKAATVREATEVLKAEGIVHAADACRDSDRAAALVQRVPGIGLATTNYSLMLLCRPGVKPDTMILRFLEEATGVQLSPSPAVVEIEAATARGVSPTELEHAIWAWQRRQ